MPRADLANGQSGMRCEDCGYMIRAQATTDAYTGKDLFIIPRGHVDIGNRIHFNGNQMLCGACAGSRLINPRPNSFISSRPVQVFVQTPVVNRPH